jgi:hypothetical protein
MTMKDGLKVLHIAVMNAGFPSDFVEMHNRHGDISRLLTFYRNKMGFPEDICLDWKVPKGKLVSKWRKTKELSLGGNSERKAHYFQPHNFAEKIYFDVVDKLREPQVNRVINEHNLDQFDVIHYDFGLDFYRNSGQAKKWKREGKKIVCCYYGSDLRVRGIIREMEELADISITAEYDHLALKPDLEFMFYPYDTTELPQPVVNQSGKVRIVHSPTNRQYKGTELIIKVIARLKEKRDLDFLLLENMPRHTVLDLKKTCDIGIECVGGIMGGYGYGKSGLEMLGMGIPVVTSMPDEYRKWLPENPFVVANNEDELYDKLLYLIDNHEYRKEMGSKSKYWVDNYHGFAGTNRRLYELYEKYGIVSQREER